MVLTVCPLDTNARNPLFAANDYILQTVQVCSGSQRNGFPVGTSCSAWECCRGRNAAILTMQLQEQLQTYRVNDSSRLSRWVTRFA